MIETKAGTVAINHSGVYVLLKDQTTGNLRLVSLTRGFIYGEKEWVEDDFPMKYIKETNSLGTFQLNDVLVPLLERLKKEADDET